MPARVELFGVEIDPLTMDQAVAQVRAWVADPVEPLPVRRDAQRRSHRDAPASCRSCGGRIRAREWCWSMAPPSSGRQDSCGGRCRSGLPARTWCRGSLTPCPRTRSCELFCWAPVRAWPSARPRTCASRWPAVEVAGTYCPPLGFERDEAQNEAIISQVAAANPDVLIVGLGAPKQELWVHRHRDRLAAKVALCVGATIDFLAGERRRAPVWMRDVGLEWLYRVASEPKRLAARYAHDAWIFPRLLAREWWRLRRPARS